MKNLEKIMFCSSLLLPAFAIASEDPPSLDVNRLIHYLVDSAESSSLLYPGGQSLSFIAQTGGSQGVASPLSYTVAPEYFGYYVCELVENGVKNNCEVSNYWDSATGSVISTSETAAGYALQLERMNMTHGSVVYDGAAWQIAVALHGKNLGPIRGEKYINAAQKQTEYLIFGQFTNDDGGFAGQNRALTTYNGVPIKNTHEAYTFRMVPTAWKLQDPFAMMADKTLLNDYVSFTNPPDAAWKAGDITWQDWKPITGENAWAHLIGPLQTDYLAYTTDYPHAELEDVVFQKTTLDNAINILVAINAMQSELGGIYYAPEGTSNNTGSQDVDPYEVSIENNASMLGGLLLLEQALAVNLNHTQIFDAQTQTLWQEGLDLTREILYGREAGEGQKKTAGLLPFLINTAWDKANNRFYTHGYANKPGYAAWYVNPDTINAVDANSWLIAILGPKFLDEHLGVEATYRTWQELQTWGTYKHGNTLMGVGFDDSKDGAQDIMSAEWTLGAIGMLKTMELYYEQHAQTLAADIQDMREGLLHLTTDYYSKSPVFAADVPKPPEGLEYLSYEQMVFPKKTAQSQGLVYASKRYFIPFGWYANAVPSTASTAWAVMDEYGYNAFAFGGHYEGVKVELSGNHYKNVK